TDIQGFALRGYTFPVARYIFLKVLDAEKARACIFQYIDYVTTGECWDEGKPESTVNVAFTFKGLMALGLPAASLISFPVEFAQGMKARGEILGDTGRNAPDHWDAMWQGDVHAWIAVYAKSPESLAKQCDELKKVIDATGGAAIVGAQDAAALVIDGKISTKEH